MTPDDHERLRVFSGIDSEQVELAKTQVRRWLALNRQRLSADQAAILESEISVLRAELTAANRRGRR